MFKDEIGEQSFKKTKWSKIFEEVNTLKHVPSGVAAPTRMKTEQAILALEELLEFLVRDGPKRKLIDNFPGNIVDRGPEEFYVSCPFKLPEGATVQTISWKAELPPKSWVTARIKVGRCRTGA